MLINEFDLEVKTKSMRKTDCDFFWLQERKKTANGLKYHIIMLMKRRQKGVYKITPNFEIVVK